MNLLLPAWVEFEAPRLLCRVYSSWPSTSAFASSVVLFLGCRHVIMGYEQFHRIATANSDLPTKARCSWSAGWGRYDKLQPTSTPITPSGARLLFRNAAVALTKYRHSARAEAHYVDTGGSQYLDSKCNIPSPHPDSSCSHATVSRPIRLLRLILCMRFALPDPRLIVQCAIL